MSKSSSPKNPIDIDFDGKTPTEVDVRLKLSIDGAIDMLTAGLAQRGIYVAADSVVTVTKDAEGETVIDHFVVVGRAAVEIVGNR